MEFCVVGTGRCGSNLLQKMLNCHPDLFVFNETHWFSTLHEWFGTQSVPPDAMLDVVQRSKHVDGSIITDLSSTGFISKTDLPPQLSPSEFFDSLGQFFAQQQGKSLWADKTPDYGYMTSILQAHWPKCKIIHLIRDGAAVARSMSKHPGYQALAALGRPFWCPLALDYQASAPPKESHISQYVDLWYQRLMRTRDEANRLHAGSYMEVRYEDILTAPEACLTRIAAFTGLPADEDWLKSASGLINPAVAEKPRPLHLIEHFQAPQLNLMQSLGYATKA